ncbi:ABC transporter substrate-binding protein [Actinophytocola sp.]|uniref:ABC transporter substrate-binding protein n=1 Tax=Actinophytocola sp. TaxID=1872138 RepID=UPI003D6B073D
MSSSSSDRRLARRVIVGAALLTAASMSLAGCSGAAVSESNSSDKPIKIGVLLPYTGPFGLYGKPMEATLRARVELAGNEVDGRAVELIFEDEATDPATAVSKANKLVDQDQVAAVVCCATGAATLAVGPILAEREIPQLGPIPNPDGLSEFATAAVAAPTAAHDAGKLGTYAATDLGHRSAVVVASDFAYGHEVAEAFKKNFVASGGQVVKEVFAPLGTSDFASYLSQLPDADVTFAGFAGADAVKFVQQYDKFGTKKRMPLIGHGPLVTELVLNQIGEAAVDVGAGFYYSSTLDNEENARFISTMKSANEDFVPSHFTAGAWATGSVLLDAIRRAGDKAGDGAELAKAVRATKIDAPWGQLEFDPETGYAIAPTYFYTVVSAGGQLEHEPVAEMP